MLYQPDCDNDCKENIREFLEFLHDYDLATEKLKDFVYFTIKQFAESNQKAYQQSNLIDLMNKVVQNRRGEIFEDTIGRHSHMDDRMHTNNSSLDNLSNGGKNSQIKRN